MTMSKTPKIYNPAPWQEILHASLVSIITGLFLVVVPYFLCGFLSGSFNIQHSPRTELPFAVPYAITLIIMLPFIQGGIAGYRLGQYRVGIKAFILIMLIILADYLLAFIILGEGIICLVMALPLYLAFVGAGLELGKQIHRYKSKKTVNVFIITAIMLTSGYNAVRTSPEYTNAISDAVTINAPASYIWRYMIEYPENKSPPEYWLWKIGLPFPIQSVADKKAVGGKRQCRFSNEVTFDEKITELKPDKVMTFAVTAQPDDPEIIGHFNLDKGQMYLEPNPDGSTTIIATSWYRLHVRPIIYFDWWVTDITRQVHFRVLNHIKSLAEADYAATKSRKL